MQVIEIIQQVIADKLARKKVPLHAMQIADIWPLFKEFGTVDQMHTQLDALIADKIITRHSTLNDFAYKPFIEDEHIDTAEPYAIRQTQGHEDE